MEIRATFCPYITCSGADSGQWFIQGFLFSDGLEIEQELNFLIDTGAVYNILSKRNLPVGFDLKKTLLLGHDSVRSGNRDYGPFPIHLIDVSLGGARVITLPFLIDMKDIYPYNLLGMHSLLSVTKNVVFQRAKGLNLFNPKRVLFQQ